MLTSCPECRTTFRVTQEHLGLRRGLVRCGQCGVVFNAYDSLLAELVTPVGEAPEPPVRADVPVTSAAPEIPVIATPQPPAPRVEPVAPRIEPRPEPRPALAPPRPELVMPASAFAAKQKPVETSESILLSEMPTGRGWQEPPRPARWLLPRLAILFLLVLLPLQTVVFLRADIAANWPQTRPGLRLLCQPLGYDVPLPHQLDKKAIVSSSLEHDAENKARTRLTLLLANRSGQAQTWPQIVLILTDLRDDPVAQRLFSPREYLAKNVDVAAGMAVGEEQEIRLDLDTGTLEATGYALDLAYR